MSLEINGDAEMSECYKERVEEHRVWSESRRVWEVSVGMKVDARDTEDIWCVGVILEIRKNLRHANTLLIHYQGKWMVLVRGEDVVYWVWESFEIDLKGLMYRR